MLPDPFNCPVDVVSGAAVTKPFHLLSVAQNSTVREQVASVDGKPRVLKISHQAVGKGANRVQRHLVRFDAYQLDADGHEDRSLPTLYAYVVVGVPDRCHGNGQVDVLRDYLIGALRGASGDVAYDADSTLFWDRIIAGEG